MSKRQALLDTLLGAAELRGNQMIANSIRNEISKLTNAREASGYQRLAREAFEPKRLHCKAA